MVTRKQKMVVRDCLVYDDTSGSNIEQTFTAKETDKKMERQNFQHGLCFS